MENNSNEEKNSSGVEHESLVSQGHGSSDWFTPGPWKIHPVFIGPHGTHFGEYRFPHQSVDGHSREYPRSEAEANARLIAAAPSLYNALIATHGCATVRDDGTCDGCIVSDALALVAPSPTGGKRN